MSAFVPRKLSGRRWSGAGSFDGCDRTDHDDDALRRRIEERLHWRCEVPTYQQAVDFDAADTDERAVLSP
ncbi:hypothetical protein DIE07_31530 [Burkholderia sp. Bp9002]|nr:hypothetical protein DIE07_31530 [Burkholderia sp. Bp9002]